MFNKNLSKILLIWVILIAATALIGKTTIASDNAVAAADFLNIGVGARSAALGGAYTSIADDPAATYWNPGGLSFVNGPQLIFSHFSWYQDINYEYMAVAYPVDEKITLGASASFLSYGSIEGYDQYDNPTGEVGSTYDLAVGLSAGYKLMDNLSVGLTAKFISISLAGNSASAFAADLGAKYDMKTIMLGLAISNIGSGLTFNEVTDKLPAVIRGGVTVKPFGSLLLASLELENQFYGNFRVKNGYEFRFEEKYFVRAGYSFIPGQDGREFGQTPSFGVGALFGPATIDYTFSPQEKFSSETIHRFSILLSL